MKKILSLLVSVLMVFTSLSVYSAAPTDAENILKLIKDRIGNTDKYETFNSSETEYNGETRYDFSWTTSKDTENYSMHITVDEHGRILSYNKYDSRNSDLDKITLNRISADEAKKSAEIQLAKLNPEIASTLQLEKQAGAENLYDNGYNFAIKRLENGIEVYNDGGHLNYSFKANEIAHFNLNYTNNPTFEDIKNTVDSKTAQGGFMKHIGLKPVYRTIYNDGVQKIILLYTPDSKANQFIDAKTNLPVEIEQQNQYNYNSKDVLTDMESGSRSLKNTLSSAEIAEFEKIEGLLSKEELINIPKTNQYMSPSNDMELENYHLWGDNENDFFASIRFVSSNKNKYKSMQFIVNAKTGEITSAYRNDAELKTDTAYNPEKAEKLANEIAKHLSGEKFSEYRAETGEQNENGVFNYTRYVNNIETEFDRISIKISNDNKLISYNCSYNKSNFPAPKGIITEQQAGKALFNSVAYDMVYIMNGEKHFIPVFMFDDEKPCEIDAFSGKLINYNGTEFKKFNMPTYADLNGHYCEKAVYELARFGINFTGEHFEPDSKITQEDFLKALLSIFNSGTDIYKIANGMNIIKPEENNPTAFVTRRDAAIYLIRAMGIEEYANLDEAFLKPFNDVDDNYGSIGILKAMGVFRGDENGMFKPNEAISRGDTAMMLYNYLTR